MTDKPVKMLMGYTTDKRSIPNKLIKFGTGGTYSHALIMFEYGSGKRVYYESISAVTTFTAHNGSQLTKNGVRGPITAGKLIDWQRAKPKRRSVFLQDVEGLTVDELAEAERFLQRATFRIEYAKLQIMQNVRTLMTGRMGSAKRLSPKKWTCSETGFRCLPMRVRDYLGIGNFLYDMVTPAGKFGLLEMIDRWNKYSRDH